MSSKKTVSNTFTVSTVEDGESAPYYFQEWFAWSNDASTSSVTTPPTISGSWATSIPAQGSYAYLWRKSIRYVWNESTRQYIGDAAQYFRMSGTNGTSIKTRGQVADASSRGNGTATIITDSGTQTITLSDGDAVTQLDDGHLYQWITEGGGKWLDLGQFKGESGKTYYTHIAWATNVTISGGEVTSVEDFTTDKSPNDTTHLWMGVLVNESSGADPSDATRYAWSYTKGVQGDSGDDAVRYEIVPSVNVITLSEDEVPTFDQVFFSLYKTVGSNNPTIYSTVQQWQNGLFKLYYVVDGVQTEVDYDYMLSYDTKANYHDIELLYEQHHEVTWVVKKNNSVVAQLSMGVVKNGEKGGTGSRGKIGRFFYFGGVWEDIASTDSFALNDAQAPYFEHTDAGQKRYHVYNPDTNPTGGTITKATMAQTSFNSKPWESMTNDFKYIITEAIFGKYAHFGSFIINEDWMLSQYGELVQPSGNIITVNDSNVNTKYSSDAPVVLNGNHISSGIIVYNVSFNVSSATTITIELTTSSESNWDWGAVGIVDNDSLLLATASSIKSDTGSVTSLKTSGSSTVSTNISLNAGAHYLYIGYFKDGSSNVGNDNASFSISGATYDLTEAKKTSGMSMSGGSRSVVPYGWFDPTDPEVKTLPASGYKFRPAFAVDGLTGETYQNDAYIRGEVHATSGEFTGDIYAKGGTIGGFTIDDTGKRFYNSDWGAGIDIDPNDGRNVKIGKNAQGVIGTESAIIRAENTRVGQTYNTAMYLNAQNGTYNYAFYGNGNGVLNGLMFGYKVQLHTIPSGNTDALTYLDIKSGSTIILNGSHSDGNVWIAAPKLSDVKKCLGINSSTTPFAIEFTVVSHAYYEFVAIAFRNAITETQNSEYPWLMDTDDRHDSSGLIPVEKSIQIAQGDVVKILLLYDNVGTTSSPSYEYRAYDLIRRV